VQFEIAQFKFSSSVFILSVTRVYSEVNNATITTWSKASSISDLVSDAEFKTDYTARVLELLKYYAYTTLIYPHHRVTNCLALKTPKLNKSETYVFVSTLHWNKWRQLFSDNEVRVKCVCKQSTASYGSNSTARMKQCCIPLWMRPLLHNFIHETVGVIYNLISHT
jgi:hypothetical protein